ncbi:hypothetical protein AB1Y20_010925 [Prymnesium parvum]|uniref:NYN domain-containing protein n=1 Tax=Prymnesium parvum TaxID=97485 RepID=A0AB34IT74_PRYPA
MPPEARVSAPLLLLYGSLLLCAPLLLTTPRLYGSLLLCAPLLYAWRHATHADAPSEPHSARQKRQPRGAARRRKAAARRQPAARLEALLLDVNNVRGAGRFARGVGEALLLDVNNVRGAGRFARGVGEALLLDVNNVRGAGRFARGVGEACAALALWAAERGAACALLAVDHGEAWEAFAPRDGLVVAFAGPKERATADDVIELSAHFCVHIASQRVLVVTSDSLLRTRCKLAARGQPHRLSCKGRDAFSSLAPPLASRGAEFFCGGETSGGAAETTDQRRAQAAALHARLRAAAATGGGAAAALAAWLNGEEAAEARVALRRGLEAHWTRQSGGAWAAAPLEPAN